MSEDEAKQLSVDVVQKDAFGVIPQMWYHHIQQFIDACDTIEGDYQQDP